MKRLGTILLLISAAAWAALAGAAELPTRTSSTAGVTMKVTPKAIAPDAGVWEFAVVLDTHTKSLDDDLLQTAVLLDAQGARHAPVAWEGAAPGGHHREGVLRFKPLAPLPQALQLLIQRPGEDAPRAFRWTLK